MIHPQTEVKTVNDSVGLGIFAIADIPKGTVMWVTDELDIRIERDLYDRMTPAFRAYVDKYSYVIDEKGTSIMNWDHSRYMNHCCFPNTLCTAYGFDVAVRDIKKGEQITCDYRMFGTEDEPEMPLACQQKKCHGILSYKDITPLIAGWDDKIIAAMNAFADVPQPLLPFLSEKVSNEIAQFLKDNECYKSSNPATAYPG